MKVFNTEGALLVTGTSGYSGVGLSGYSGYSGGTGSNGTSGYSGAGFSGYSGYSGLDGIASASGYSGFSGKSGYSGYSGLSGYSGYSGSGLSGYSGAGISGYSGYSGQDGAATSGYSGYSGKSGYSGYSGIGLSGYSGYSGIGFSGYSGFSGAGTSGYSGYSGLSGYSGYSGKSGYSGYSGLSNLLFTTQSGTTYTLQLSDSNQGVKMTSSSNNTVTVPPNSSVAFPVGTQILIEQGGAGTSSVAAGSGVTLDGSSLSISAQYSIMGLIKQATDSWLIVVDAGGGTSGFSGYSGRSGYSGFSGAGLSGYSGYSGLDGIFSASGYSGYSGKSGYSGYSGYSGAGDISTNRQTASYTLVLSDQNKLVEMNVASANNLTVPTNASVAFTIGCQIPISQYGAGQTTVVASGGVTIRSAGGALKLRVQYSLGTLIKIGSDDWYLAGDIST